MCTVEGSGGLSKVFNAILKPGSSSFQIVSAPDTLVGTTFKDLQVKNPQAMDPTLYTLKSKFECKAC
jgi:hypothetical protein